MAPLFSFIGLNVFMNYLRNLQIRNDMNIKTAIAVTTVN